MYVGDYVHVCLGVVVRKSCQGTSGNMSHFLCVWKSITSTSDLFLHLVSPWFRTLSLSAWDSYVLYSEEQGGPWPKKGSYSKNNRRMRWSQMWRGGGGCDVQKLFITGTSCLWASTEGRWWFNADSNQLTLCSGHYMMNYVIYWYVEESAWFIFGYSHLCVLLPHAYIHS